LHHEYATCCHRKITFEVEQKIGSRACFGASLTLKPEPTLNENSKKQG
jgi:hypothetical protein